MQIIFLKISKTVWVMICWFIVYCFILLKFVWRLASFPKMLPEPRPMTAPVLQTGPMSGVLALSADWSLRSRGLWLWRISNQISIPRLLVKWSPHGIDPISTTINRYQQLCLWFVADSHTHKVFLIVEHVFLSNCNIPQPADTLCLTGGWNRRVGLHSWFCASRQSFWLLFYFYKKETRKKQYTGLNYLLWL